MRIGLYFGSFNPIHHGHLIIASHILNEGLVERLWFVVSPQNPLKPNHSLLNEYDRLHLVRVAIEEDSRMKVTDIEFSLPRPSYTINTLTYLKEKYPDDEFSVIMGSDSFGNIGNWKNYDEILKGYRILVYKRPGFEVAATSENVRILDAPLLQISATHIRQTVRAGKSIRYLVPLKVREEIEANRYFK